MRRRFVLPLLILAACHRDPVPASAQCVDIRPAPATCALSSDCFRGDLCTTYDCAAGHCVYTPRNPNASGVVTCDPGRPDGGRWTCQGPDADAPGGRCCQVAVVVTSGHEAAR
jgi:hypothetical protein